MFRITIEAIWFDWEDRLLGCFSVSNHTDCYILKPSSSEIIFLFKLEAADFWRFVRLGVLLHMYRTRSGKEEAGYHFVLLSGKVAFTLK